jgi:hypothetical protein
MSDRPSEKQTGDVFDPAVFLETVGNGRTVSTHPKGGTIFTQGETAQRRARLSHATRPRPLCALLERR